VPLTPAAGVGKPPKEEIAQGVTPKKAGEVGDAAKHLDNRA